MIDAILKNFKGVAVEITDKNELLVKVNSGQVSLAEAQQITDALNTLVTNSNNASGTKTPYLIRSSASGSIATTCYSFSVANVGSVNGTLLGQTIKPGERINFSADGLNNKFAANSITYDGTGTELLIAYIN